MKDGFVDVLTNYKSIKCTKERYILSLSVCLAKKANQEKASELTLLHFGSNYPEAKLISLLIPNYTFRGSCTHVLARGRLCQYCGHQEHN